MSWKSATTAMLLTALMLLAAPASGQVVATIGDMAVTKSELDLELQIMSEDAERDYRDDYQGLIAASNQQATDAALEAIVSRKIVASIARQRKIDQQPSFSERLRRIQETQLVDALQRDIASGVTAPDNQDIRAFIAANPDMFAQHKTYRLDQIVFVAPKGDTALLKSLEPLKTMEAVEGQLTRASVTYKRDKGTLDPNTVEPGLMKAILALPVGEIFVVPNKAALVASVIIKTDVVPLQGDEALAYAMKRIRDQRVTDAADRQLKALIVKQRASVRYETGYMPSRPPSSVAGGDGPTT